MRSFYTSLLVISLLPACGGTIANTDGRTTGAGGVSAGTGDGSAGTAGSSTGSGGRSTGGAGTSGSAASGGRSTGTGGGSAGSGGRSTGTGGSSTGSGGSSTGSGGRSTGSGGGSAGSGGRSTGTGGGSAGSGGGGRGGRGGAGGSSSGTGGTAAGTLLFVGDFETGDLSQWPYVERCATNRMVVYSAANAPTGAPAPRGGQYAVQFHVLDGDVSPCTSSENPRAELDSPPLFYPGNDRWEAWSVYVPTNHPTCSGTCPSGSFFCFQEDYGSPFDGSPSIGWFFDFATSPNHMRMDRGDQYSHDQPWIATLITGQWMDFLVHKKFTNTDDGTGFVEAWVNGNPITFSTCNCTKLSMQTMHSTQPSLEFYLTAYRLKGMLASFDTFYDEVRVGTTRAAVELPPQ